MKKKLLIIAVILTLTGCVKIEDNYDVVADTIISKKADSNRVSNSYKYYLPVNLSCIYDYEYNQKLKYNDITMYFYIDIVSYYYKNKLNFDEENDYNYYYKKLSTTDKSGFIGITQESEDVFFVKIIYNYAKVEFYTNKANLNGATFNSLIMLNSITYNDLVINTLVGESSDGGGSVIYELDKPEDSESKFSQYLEEYVEEEENYEQLPDE